MDASTQPRIPQPPGMMTAYRFVPDEVLIKVLAAGVCHSDCHLLDASTKEPHFDVSFTLGHEGAGIVVAHGEGVTADAEASQRLAIGTRGFASSCFALPLLGLGQDGSWTEYVKARAATVVPVPSNNPGDTRLTPGTVAAATDAVMTPWRALKRVAEVKPGLTIVVLGCGGLGVNAIQIAKRVLGAGTVIASDVKADSLEVARKFGADCVVLPDDIMALLAGKKSLVKPVADFVGVQSTFDAGMETPRTGGTLLLVGLGAESVEIRPLAAAMKQLVIKTSYGGDLVDLQECLHAISEGQIRPEVEQRRMDQCGNVVQGLSKGEIRGRVVLVPPLQ